MPSRRRGTGPVTLGLAGAGAWTDARLSYPRWGRLRRVSLCPAVVVRTTRPVAGRPVAGRPVAGRPVAGRPVAGRPEVSDRAARRSARRDRIVRRDGTDRAASRARSARRVARRAASRARSARRVARRPAQVERGRAGRPARRGRPADTGRPAETLRSDCPTPRGAARRRDDTLRRDETVWWGDRVRPDRAGRRRPRRPSIDGGRA
jgi:hypothetical protein